MSQLDAEDLLLRKPLPGYAVYTFDGEAEHGELAFSKGQRIHIFCEDFGEGWSIGMLVDANGLECATAAQKLSRGLLPKGFVQVSRVRKRQMVTKYLPTRPVRY